MENIDQFHRKLGSIEASLFERLTALAHTAFARKAVVTGIDAGVVSAALILAYLARFDGSPPIAAWDQMLLFLPVFVGVYLGVGYLAGFQKLVWRYVGLQDCLVLLRAVIAAGAVILLFNLFLSEVLRLSRVPLGVVLVHPILTYAGWLAARLIRRRAHEFMKRRNQEAKARRRAARKAVLLVGAGQAGLNLLRELRSSEEYDVKGFLDDDPQLQRRLVDGLPVLGTTRDLVSAVEDHEVGEVMFCMPSAPRKVLRRLAEECRRVRISALSVPSLAEIMAGGLGLNRLKPVSTEDLLGRDSIPYTVDEEEIRRIFSGRRILVTGAGGSIGSELCRQLQELGPSSLILVDKDENCLFEIDAEIRESFDRVTTLVADIRESGRMEGIFAAYRPEVVFHAAAYKHVPLMERNPAEAVLTNVRGTSIVAALAAAYGADTFVMISTDKAVNPTSIMGASKRLAEMQVQAIARRGEGTDFCCVRFGNVLGSRGSVVPHFQRLISQGKNLPVTHPDMSRYFMTIPEAVQLVIRAGSLGRNGEIFLLDMGTPVKIVDLARNLIRLSGLVPDEDIGIEFIGLRPGEKLYEELLAAGENGVRSTKYSKILIVRSPEPKGLDLGRAVRDLEEAAGENDAARIRRLFESLDIGYRPATTLEVVRVPEPRTSPLPSDHRKVV